MDATLQRLSSSIEEKLKESEQLNRRGDDLEEKIETLRQLKTSPMQLSRRKLGMATLQGSIKNMPHMLVRGK